MVIYDLACDSGHQFEGWFTHCEDYVRQQAEGLLSCPVCGSGKVAKKPTVSRVNTHRSDKTDNQRELGRRMDGGVGTDAPVSAIHDYVDKNYDDVGSDFPEEARRIHYGEAEERNIRGTASASDVGELVEEGVPVTPLPPRPADKDKLN